MLHGISDRPLLIGLSGPLGAGKSLAGRILAAHTRLPVVPFARPLKAMLETIGVPPANLYGTPAQKAEPLAVLGGKSAREALQTLGTDWGRKMVADDIWLRAWLAITQKGAIADDVRFPNEAEAILDRGGVVFQIVRDENDVYSTPAHESENFTAVPFTERIVNDRCPTVLRDRLMSAAVLRKIRVYGTRY